jgi:hypothetical protein
VADFGLSERAERDLVGFCVYTGEYSEPVWPPAVTQGWSALDLLATFPALDGIARGFRRFRFHRGIRRLHGRRRGRDWMRASVFLWDAYRNAPMRAVQRAVIVEVERQLTQTRPVFSRVAKRWLCRPSFSALS